jgi:hypothetical protein
MSTILEMVPGVTVTLSDGEITSADSLLAEIGAKAWGQERAKGYEPWPEWRWAEAMKKRLPMLKVVQLDKAQPSDPGVVY